MLETGMRNPFSLPGIRRSENDPEPVEAAGRPFPEAGNQCGFQEFCHIGD